MATVLPPSSRRKANKRLPTAAAEAANSDGPSRLAEPNESPSCAKKVKTTEDDFQGKVKINPVKVEQEQPPPPPPPPPQPNILDWSNEDLTELVSKLENCLPKHDNAKYSTLVEKLDWEKITFGTYTPSECKTKWNMIMTRLRRYRTLTDMVTDAREWLKHPWISYNGSKKQQKHPEMPKKPLTPYFRYFSEKREKYGKAHPKMTMTDLAKFLSKKYQQLSEKKKQKYKDGYERENEIYKQEFERFKKEHPESQVPGSGRSNSSHDSAGPSKPINPFQFFSADRLKRPDYLQLDKKEASERARKQWNVLSDGKRIKWIRKALQDEHRYELQLAEYAATHPDFKVETLKTVLSKAEKELKDKYDGKPERPPNSGYSLFSRIKLRELKDIPAKEKMAEISRRWKDLSEVDRSAFNKQAQKANQRYKEKYAVYLSSLNEEGRQKLLTEAANGKVQKRYKVPAPVVDSAVPQLTNGTTKQNEKSEKEVSAKSDPSSPPTLKKPSSAMFLFQQEKLVSCQQKHPGFSKQELLRLISREFTELPEKKKEKYRRLAEETRKLEAKKNVAKSEEVVGSCETQGKKKLFKGEPRKPPQSGYGVFSTEMLSVLTDIDPKQRMAEIAKRWKAMTPTDQQKYKIRSQELSKKYKKEINKFLNALPEEDLKEYYRLRKGPKKPAVLKSSAKVSAASGKSKQTKQKPETESSEEGEEAVSAVGGEEDSSAEEGTDQSDNEESASGSEDSGSDSDEDDSDEDHAKKPKSNDSSSDDSGSDSESGSSDGSSDTGSDSDEEEE